MPTRIDLTAALNNPDPDGLLWLAAQIRVLTGRACRAVGGMIYLDSPAVGAVMLLPSEARRVLRGIDSARSRARTGARNGMHDETNGEAR